MAESKFKDPVKLLETIGKFLLVAAFIFVIAYAIYATVKSSSSSGSFHIDWRTFLFPHYHVVTSTGTGVNYGNQNSGNGQQSGSSNQPPSQPVINPAEIPAGFAAKDLSPYFKKFFFSVYPAAFGSYGQVSLSGYYGQNQNAVDVTGWVFRANRGSLIIPQAVNFYDPSGLTPQTDIYLRQGDTLYLYTTVSPVGGNLHLNKCLGYLPGLNSIPQISVSCPSIDRSQIAGFTGVCQNYIMSLGNCRIPSSNPPIPQSDYQCQEFLNTLNYKGCFEAHRDDSDFLSNQWYAWTGANFLDPLHDRVRLFDRQGLLVGEYIY
jgi:hypothetical protein